MEMAKRGDRSMTTKKRKTISGILLAFSILCLLISAGFLAKYLIDSWTSQNEISHLSDTRKNEGTKKLTEKNADMCGWISIKGTRISYPVMYTPEDPEFYLRKNFKKEYSVHGLPFIDGNTEYPKSLNYTIYGHHMQDGTMFSNLTEYRDDPEFINTHRYVRYTGKGASGKYTVFAYGTYTTRSGIFSNINVLDETSFNEYMKAVTEKASYLGAASPKYGDRIVTLVTCSDATAANDKRFILSAFMRR